MNIFVLDYNSKKNAEYHFDKHVVKMPLEVAQLVSTAYHVTRLRGYSPDKISNISTLNLEYKSDLIIGFSSDFLEGN